MLCRRSRFAQAGGAGRLRATLEKSGTTIGPYDLLIVGQALARGLTFVTANASEFARVQGLGWEDWTRLAVLGRCLAPSGAGITLVSPGQPSVSLVSPRAILTPPGGQALPLGRSRPIGPDLTALHGRPKNSRASTEPARAQIGRQKIIYNGYIRS
jgi:hypothetical protein